MAKPPPGYPRPTSEPCGRTWKTSLFVTGKLPGTKGFGADITHTVAPVVPDLRAGKPRLGWGGTYEEQRRDGMFSRLEAILAQLDASDALLSPEETASIQWLLDRAVSELDAVTAIHKLTDPMGRGKRRQKIYRRYIDAAWHIRCAEYSMWLLLLYRQALAAWYKEFWADLPDGVVSKPESAWLPGKVVQSLGRAAEPDGYNLPSPPPPTPHGAALPQAPTQ